MPLEISPVHRKDLESCTRLRYTGFRKDAMVQALYGGGETEEMISYSINEARKKFGEDPNERSVKVKDSETGEIIAYSLWKYNNDRTALENWDQMPEITDSPPGWDKELMLKIEHEQAVSMNKYMGQKAFLCKCTNISKFACFSWSASGHLSAISKPLKRSLHFELRESIDSLY